MTPSSPLSLRPVGAPAFADPGVPAQGRETGAATALCLHSMVSTWYPSLCLSHLLSLGRPRVPPSQPCCPLILAALVSLPCSEPLHALKASLLEPCSEPGLPLLPCRPCDLAPLPSPDCMPTRPASRALCPTVPNSCPRASAFPPHFIHGSAWMVSSGRLPWW